MCLNSNFKYFISAGGTSYTRWGRNDCPNNNGTQLVYAGNIYVKK